MWLYLDGKMASTPWARRDRGHRVRTVNAQPTLWDSILPPELLVLPVELGRVDALLDDPVFFAPFAAHFDLGRPAVDPGGDLPAVDVLEVPVPAGL